MGFIVFTLIQNHFYLFAFSTAYQSSALNVQGTVQSKLRTAESDLKVEPFLKDIIAFLIKAIVLQPANFSSPSSLP